MKSKGFTLMELLVALTVLVLLITVAVPMFTTTIANNKLVTLRDNLINSLQYARTEAISRNVNVAVCPSLTGDACLPNDDWSQGWIVYTDTLTGTATQVGNILRREEGESNVDFAITGSPASLSPSAFFRYTPQGILSLGSTTGNQTVGFCHPDALVPGRAVVVAALSGQVRSGEATDSGCP